jgi:hypothetical protein
MMRRIVTGSLVTAVLLVGLGLAVADIWIGLPLCIFIGGFWLAGVLYGRSWLVTLGFVSLILVTAVAGLLGVSGTMLLTGIALALFAWTMRNVGQQLTAGSEPTCSGPVA